MSIACCWLWTERLPAKGAQPGANRATRRRLCQTSGTAARNSMYARQSIDSALERDPEKEAVGFALVHAFRGRRAGSSRDPRGDGGAIIGVLFTAGSRGCAIGAVAARQRGCKGRGTRQTGGAGDGSSTATNAAKRRAFSGPTPGSGVHHLPPIPIRIWSCLRVNTPRWRSCSARAGLSQPASRSSGCARTAAEASNSAIRPSRRRKSRALREVRRSGVASTGNCSR